MTNCDWCGTEDIKSTKNNQGDDVCFDCIDESSAKCEMCKENNSMFRTAHSNFHICDSDKCRNNYLDTHCLERI